METAVGEAAALLGVDAGAGRAAVRGAFRAVIRRERPDLGWMGGDRLARLLEARDILLAAAPDEPCPAPRRPPAAPPAGARRSRPWGFDAAHAPGAPPAPRLVDLYA